MCRTQKNIFLPPSAERVQVSCWFQGGPLLHRSGWQSCGVAEFAEETFHFLAECVRVDHRSLARFTAASFELNVNEEFEVRPGEQALPLTAKEEVSQEGCPLKRIRNSQWRSGFGERVVAFRAARGAGLPFGPVEYVAPHHAGEGEG